MAFCNISKDGYLALLQMVYKEVYDDRFTSVSSLMKYVYDSIYDSKKDNKIQALTYSGLVPQLLSLIAVRDKIGRDKIMKVTGVDALLKLQDMLTDNLMEVNKTIFGKGSVFTKEEGELVIKNLLETNDYQDLDNALMAPNVITFLSEPGNEEIATQLKAKWEELREKLKQDNIKKNQAIIEAARGEKLKEEKAKEELEREAKGLPKEPEVYDVEPGEEIIPETYNVEEDSAKAHLTPMKSVSKMILSDENTGPNDEAKINSDEYDVLVNEFLLKNSLLENNITGTSKFSVTLQNDTDELIKARKIKEEDRLEALANKGQVAVVQLESGVNATLGNMGLIKDKNDPLYNAPIVFSVNKQAFDKFIDIRALIYSDRFNVPYADVMKYYISEGNRLELAREHLSDDAGASYPLTVIHQSKGVIELTAEGNVVDRFKNGDKTAVRAFRILKRDDRVHGTDFKKGQIIVTVEGAKKAQAFAVSAPKIMDLRGDIGTKIKDAIEYYLYKQYDTRKEAQDVAQSFLKKVLYTKRGHIHIRVAKDILTNTYKIIYEKKQPKKDGTAGLKPISQSQIGAQRINISEALVTSEQLIIPSTIGDTVVQPQTYSEFVKDNLMTNRKAVRDNNGNFHLDPVSAYFSFQLPESLVPGVRIVKTENVEFTKNGKTETYQVNYYTNGSKDFNKDGEKLDIRQLTLSERVAIIKLIDEGAAKEKVISPEEQLLLDSQKLITEKEAAPVETGEQVTPPVETPISSATTIVTKKSGAVKTTTVFKLSDGSRFVVNMSDANPIIDAFNKDIKLKKKGLTSERLEEINSMLIAGTISKNLIIETVGDKYIIMVKDGDNYKVFNNKLEVVPDSSLGATKEESDTIINNFKERNKIC